MSTKRLLGFTSCRSDYDLMSGIYQALSRDPDVDFALMVSGPHLSQTFGHTLDHILADGIPILARIESLFDSNSLSSRLKGATILMQAAIPYLEQFAPDALIYAGDREDAIATALLGAYLAIPSVHFFGGDHASDGNVDNPVRHACSKLSSAHFVSHPVHAERLHALGEPDFRIHVVGSPALDKFVNTPLLEKAELLRRLGRPDWQNFATVIYHPILGQEALAGAHFKQVLDGVRQAGLKAFVGIPNTDAGARSILEVIQTHRDQPEFCFYQSLSRTDFVNLLRQSELLIGNSSAGLAEAPLVPLAAVNVGLRQQGRLAAQNLVFVDQNPDAILTGIREVLSPDFQASLAKIESPYGRGDSVPRSVALLKDLDYQSLFRKTEDPLS